jgi:hypothetical protein
MGMKSVTFLSTASVEIVQEYEYVLTSDPRYAVSTNTVYAVIETKSTKMTINNPEVILIILSIVSSSYIM